MNNNTYSPPPFDSDTLNNNNNIAADECRNPYETLLEATPPKEPENKITTPVDSPVQIETQA
jgi:hypothetical protein